LPLIALCGLSFEWIVGSLARGAQQWWAPTRVLTAFGVVLLIVSIASINIPMVMGLTITLSILAIIALGAAIVLERWAHRRLVAYAIAEDHRNAPRWPLAMRQIVAAGSLVLAIALLIPTLWNMQRLVYYEPSVAPNEMLIYVQTTTDVQKVMGKINALDKQLYNGTHQLHIGLTGAAVWPYAWYLHDYPNTYYNFSSTKDGYQPEVIVADLEGGAQNTTSVVGDRYASQQYRLRWWWDESYKLPQCTATKTSQCSPQASWGTGDGPFLWITYGAFPPTGCQDLTNPKCDPQNAPFNGALAANRYWNWLWLRQNISGTQPGSTDFVFFVRNDLTSKVQP